jgi:predicted Zn-dependent protease
MKRRRSSIVFLVLLLLITGISYGARSRVRISAAQQREYSKADIDAEVLFGRNLAARILGNYPLWDNSKVNRYVNLVGKSLSFHVGRGELTFTFGVLDSPSINAFATPGGYIFITRGALEQMVDEAQLAAVLGHEMAHVVERHMVRELNLNAQDGSAFGGLTALIGGATGSMRSSLEITLNQATAILFEKGYRLEDELAADRDGILIAAGAGYDPSALGSYLQRVGQFEVAPQTPSIEHPVLKQRLAAIETTLATHGLAGLSGTRYKERWNETVSSH